MSREKALIDLLAKVEAGEFPFWCGEAALGYRLAGYAERAFLGSLDTALALHKAVLPEWCWNVWPDGAHVRPDRNVIDGTPADNQNPARAWLIAILRALISQEATA